ncbi:YceI family protein [Fulvimonas yonginensis]|uniref:YceI family protein n=1 Tax=Fulvimonas yonginensis TaxID=1495200 RepID=A0ABU8J792_9GAMM
MHAAVRGGLLLALGLASFAAAAVTGQWHIDSRYSHADFGVRLFWLHTVRGRFEQVEGTVEPRAGGNAVVNAQIAVNSLAMDSTRLRQWVLGEEFFDAARHPVLRFVSAPVPGNVLDAGGVLDGQLTLRGITRPMRFVLLPARCTADACTIQAHGQLRRSEFGMNAHHAVLSDRVELALSIALERSPD